MSDVTRILSAIEHGDPHAAEHLLPLVYDELRKLAAQKLAQETPGQTLQATALVHEAYIRLVDADKAQHWDTRGHFFSAAAEALIRIGPAAVQPLADQLQSKSTSARLLFPRCMWRRGTTFFWADRCGIMQASRRTEEAMQQGEGSGCWLS